MSSLSRRRIASDLEAQLYSRHEDMLRVIGDDDRARGFLRGIVLASAAVQGASDDDLSFIEYLIDNEDTSSGRADVVGAIIDGEYFYVVTKETEKSRLRQGKTVIQLLRILDGKTQSMRYSLSVAKSDRLPGTPSDEEIMLHAREKWLGWTPA